MKMLLNIDFAYYTPNWSSLPIRPERTQRTWKSESPDDILQFAKELEAYAYELRGWINALDQFDELVRDRFAALSSFLKSHYELTQDQFDLLWDYVSHQYDKVDSGLKTSSDDPICYYTPETLKEVYLRFHKLAEFNRLFNEAGERLQCEPTGE